MSRSNEAFWWSLFSAGGVVSALVVPGLILATGFFLPTNDAEAAAEIYQQVHGVMSFFIVKLVIFGVLFFSFFHCAHRLRHTLMDLGLRSITPVLYFVFYGGALIASLYGAYVLLSI